MRSRGYGYVGAPRFGAEKKLVPGSHQHGPTFGACDTGCGGAKFGAAKLFQRKTGEENFGQIITPCEEYKIINWEEFWEYVKEYTESAIDAAKVMAAETGKQIVLSETKLAAEILDCMDPNGNFISKKYYKLAYSPSYAQFVFELNKYILGIFYQHGLITETQAKQAIAGILKNLNARAL